MPQPFDYSLNIPNPKQQVLGALQLAKGIEQMKASRTQAQQAAQTREALQADLSALGSNPSPSALAGVMAKYPQLSEEFKRTYDVLNEEQKKARLDQASQVYAAIESGQPDIAKELMTGYADAYRNAGAAKEAKTMDDMAKLIELSPETARTSTGLFLARALGPEKFTETFDNLSKVSREQSLLPGEIKQQAAELGLTEAQARQAAANADKLSADAQKTLIELEAAKKGGVLSADPEKLFEAEQKLRKEYSAETDIFQQTQENFRKINAADDTAAGDLSLIFSYMKMLDPGSVVREGEFASAQNAAGVPGRVVNLYNQLLNGERLNSNQRGAFKNQAKKLYQATSIREKDIRKGLKRVVDNYGLNEKNVFLTESPSFDDGGGQSKLPMQNAQGWRLMTDAQGNRAYVSPDGTQFQEVK